MNVDGPPINGSAISRARESLARSLYPIRWLVALTAGALVVLVVLYTASFIRTGEFGITAELGSSSVQSDLDGIVLDGSNAFAIGESAILDGAAPELDRAAEILRDRPELEVAVIGHARVEGNQEFDNVRLSERRALLVIDALVDRGVRFERLIPVGRGSEESMSSDSSGEGLAQDQRVELVVVTPG